MKKITFTLSETGIIGSILAQKMGYDLPKEFKGAELNGLVGGNESQIIYWLKRIPSKAVAKFGISKDIKAIEEKFTSGLQAAEGKKP